MPISLSVSLPAIPDFQANGYLLLGRLQFCNSSDQTIFLYSPRNCNQILIDANSGYLCATIRNYYMGQMHTCGGDLSNYKPKYCALLMFSSTINNYVLQTNKNMFGYMENDGL